MSTRRTFANMLNQKPAKLLDRFKKQPKVTKGTFQPDKNIWAKMKEMK